MLKRKVVFVLLLVLLGIGVVGCSKKAGLVKNSKKYTENHDYDKAVRALVDALKIDPEYKEALENINPIYSEGQIYYLESIELFKQDSNFSKYDNILKTYGSLNSMNDAIRELSLELREKIAVEPKMYNEDIKNTKLEAAEVCFGMAMEKYNNSKDKLDYKEAAKTFKRVMYYNQEYPNAREKYDESREKAMVTVVLFPIKNSRDYSYNVAVDRIMYNKLLEKFINDIGVSEFAKIKGYEEFEFGNEYMYLTENDSDKMGAAAAKAGADLFIIIDINSVIYNYPRTIVLEERLVKEVETGKVREWNSKKERYEERKIYEKVSATKYKHTKETGATMSITYKILSPRQGSALLKMETLSEKSQDKVSWVTYRGDERAYKNEYSEYEQQTKQRDEMLEMVTNETSNKIHQNIGNFLK